MSLRRDLYEGKLPVLTDKRQPTGVERDTSGFIWVLHGVFDVEMLDFVTDTLARLRAKGGVRHEIEGDGYSAEIVDEIEVR